MSIVLISLATIGWLAVFFQLGKFVERMHPKSKGKSPKRYSYQTDHFLSTKGKECIGINIMFGKDVFSPCTEGWAIGSNDFEKDLEEGKLVAQKKVDVLNQELIANEVRS